MAIVHDEENGPGESTWWWSIVAVAVLVLVTVGMALRDRRSPADQL
jgi:hypothetical protein